MASSASVFCPSAVLALTFLYGLFRICLLPISCFQGILLLFHKLIMVVPCFFAFLDLLIQVGLKVFFELIQNIKDLLGVEFIVTLWRLRIRSLHKGVDCTTQLGLYAQHICQGNALSDHLTEFVEVNFAKAWNL